MRSFSFCERLSIPVLLESPYPSAYSAGYPQSNGCYLGLFRREAEALKGADTIVALGGQLVTERKYYEQDPFQQFHQGDAYYRRFVAAREKCEDGCLAFSDTRVDGCCSRKFIEKAKQTIKNCENLGRRTYPRLHSKKQKEITRLLSKEAAENTLWNRGNCSGPETIPRPRRLYHNRRGGRCLLIPF